MNKLLFSITFGLLLGNSLIAQQGDTLQSNASKNNPRYDTIHKPGEHNKLRDSLRTRYRNQGSDSLRTRYRNQGSDSLRTRYRTHGSDSLRNKYRNQRSDSLRNKYRNQRSDSLRNKYRNHGSDSLRSKYRNHRSDSGFRKGSVPNRVYRHHGNQHNNKRLQQALNLSSDQELAINKINKEVRLKAASISRDTTMTPQSRRAAKQALISDRNKQLAATLTPGQQKKYAELQQKMLLRRQQRMMQNQRRTKDSLHQARPDKPGAKFQNKKQKTHQPQRNNGDGKRKAAADSSSTARLQNTYWKLLHINDKPVVTPENAREIHIMFGSDGKSLKGFAGCNGLGGDYTLGASQSIHINAISTKMYCDRMDAENFLTNAIGKANRYMLKGEKLFLYENNNLLASFNAVYL